MVNTSLTGRPSWKKSGKKALNFLIAHLRWWDKGTAIIWVHNSREGPGQLKIKSSWSFWPEREDNHGRRCLNSSMEDQNSRQGIDILEFWREYRKRDQVGQSLNKQENNLIYTLIWLSLIEFGFKFFKLRIYLWKQLLILN